MNALDFEKFLEQKDKFAAGDIELLMKSYRSIAKNYGAAIREVKTKLEILDDDFELTHKHNPIHHIESRVKSPASIIEKIARKGIDPNPASIQTRLLDIAGIRVICYYIEDIYTIAELLKNQADIEVVEEVDYIKNPKGNGYRSLHLIVTVPVFLSDRTEKIPVEVQIRTIAMDFWASLEHQIRYKSSGAIPKFISDELYECAEATHLNDLKMQRIHSFLEELDNMQ